MDQSYWDLSSILADSVRIPCHVNYDSPGLAHLQGAEGGSSSAQEEVKQQSSSVLKKGSRIDVPYWLGELLGLHGVVDLSLPKPYSSRVRNALDADAQNVQLRSLNAWWYAVGTRLCSLMDANDLNVVLQKTYSARLRMIFSSGQHLAATSLVRGLSDTQDTPSQTNQNMDSLGGTSSIQTSQGMIDFLQGVEETEAVLLRTAQSSAICTSSYLTSGH